MLSGTNQEGEYGTNGNNGTDGKELSFPFISLFPFVPYSLFSHLKFTILAPQAYSAHPTPARL
jgi:hypothetical protein